MKAMKVSIDKSEITRATRIAQGICDRKSTMPILSCLVVRAEGRDSLLIAATDLQVFLWTRLASTNQSEGGLCLHAKEFHDVVSSARAGDVALSLNVKNQRLAIESGKLKAKLPTQREDSYPALPDPGDAAFVDINAATLKEMIDKTVFSCSSDTSRPDLNGIFLESDGSIATIASTNGHRLSRVIRKLEFPKLKAGIIIPSKGAGELSKVLGMGGDVARVAVVGDHLYVGSGTVVLAVKLTSAQFPPYQQIIPDGSPIVATADRGELLEAVRHSQVLIRGEQGIQVSVADKAIEVSTASAGVGEIQDEVSADVTGNPITVGLNPRYMTEYLQAIDSERVDLEFSGELDPVVIRPHGDDTYLGLIMPMRL